MEEVKTLISLLFSTSLSFYVTQPFLSISSLASHPIISPIPLPRGPEGKESACQCRRHRRYGYNLWVRKIPWRKKWQPTPVFLPGKFHRQMSLKGYSWWGWKELDTTEHMAHSPSFPYPHYPPTPSLAQCHCPLLPVGFLTWLLPSSSSSRGLWSIPEFRLIFHAPRWARRQRMSNRGLALLRFGEGRLGTEPSVLHAPHWSPNGVTQGPLVPEAETPDLYSLSCYSLTPPKATSGFWNAQEMSKKNRGK